MNKVLEKHVQDFMNYKRNSLSGEYAGGKNCLRLFLSYTSIHFPFDELPTKDSVLSFLSEHESKPGSLYGYSVIMREFSKYLILNGYKEAYLLPSNYTVQPTPKPPYYLDSNSINSFFQAVDHIEAFPKNAHSQYREIIFPALYRMMYCCGTRDIEMIRLKCEDVHLEKRYFDILESKGYRSRRVFMSEEVNTYMLNYHQTISVLVPDRIFFFPSTSTIQNRQKTKAVSKPCLEQEFETCWKKAFPDFDWNEGDHPTPYDFRHHFAYANLNRWTEEGKDINVMLPYLMRYMGHESVSETLYYFHFVPSFFGTYNNIVKQLNDSVIPEVYDNEKDT